MGQTFIPAVFYRGGTSKGVFFHARDLPAEREACDPILLAALGSPDPYGRQLNGMGGGISSLSKAVIIGPPTRPDAEAYPSAACPAPCSWRTRMCRSSDASISGSYTGRIAPPGMPKTSVTPSFSSERTTASAPEISGADAVRAGGRGTAGAESGGVISFL